MAVQRVAVIGALTTKDAHKTSRLIRAVIKDTACYSAVARRREAAQFTPGHVAALGKRTDSIFLVAKLATKRGTSVVGFCFGSLYGGVSWIEWIGVATASRGQGIASKLFKAYQGSAKKRGVHALWFDTRVNNFASMALNKKMRAKIVGRLNHHWYGQDFYIWQKQL